MPPLLSSSSSKSYCASHLETFLKEFAQARKVLKEVSNASSAQIFRRFGMTSIALVVVFVHADAI